MKIGLFFLTLFLGIQAITLADCIVANLSVPADADIVVDGSDLESTQVERPGGIRILYDGTWSDDETPVLLFLIYNGSFRELSCIGYGGRCLSPQIRLRGLDVKAWACMNGSSRYTIKPGESAELWVSPSDFELLPEQTEEVVIGYKFEDPSGSSNQYFAAPLVLPVEFRTAVRKYQKELRDLESGIH